MGDVAAKSFSKYVKSPMTFTCQAFEMDARFAVVVVMKKMVKNISVRHCAVVPTTTESMQITLPHTIRLSFTKFLIKNAQYQYPSTMIKMTHIRHLPLQATRGNLASKFGILMTSTVTDTSV